MDLGQRLVSAGVLSELQLELAQRERKSRGGSFNRIVVDLNLLSPERLANFLAKESSAPFVDLKTLVVDRAVLDFVPVDLMKRLLAVPISRYNGSLTVAMADPLDVTAIDSLRHATGLHIEVKTATERDIHAFIEQSCGGLTETLQQSIDRLLDEGTEQKIEFGKDLDAEQDLLTANHDDAPVIQLVSQIIARAVGNKASDIHFEPEEKMMRIRTRVDGLLVPDILVPRSLRSAVTARLKIMGDMDVAESRVPQDGRATVFVGGRRVNLRVSSLPTSFGENVVVRILDPSNQILQIGSLGFQPPVEKKLRDLLDRPHGVVIVTGPTGSGKTTTLYAILTEICTPDVSIFTLEDPVEFRMPGIRQTQIKEEVGLTFGTGLRALLRQDPDIILVGETRDTETAQLMVRAALTGHLVFSTLHTNDAPGAVPRLLDMGVEPYLLPDCLLGVLAQRLVRRLCDRCKEPLENPEKILERYRIQPPAGVPVRLWKGRGCAACKSTGYRGRQAVFELMTIEPSFYDPIVRRAGAPDFARLAREAGMTTMFEDGLRRALEGVTTLEELLRVTKTDDIPVPI